jgi:hypothetical protein
VNRRRQGQSRFKRRMGQGPRPLLRLGPRPRPAGIADAAGVAGGEEEAVAAAVIHDRPRPLRHRQ